MAAPRATDEFQRLVTDAQGFYEAGRPGDAERAYRAALKMEPRHPAILHNLGALAASQDEHLAAVQWFDATIAAEPGYASAQYYRAVSLEALGRPSEALVGFARAAALDPAHYASHRGAGFLYLAAGDRGRALDHFARTYELRRGVDHSGIAVHSLEFANRTKLRHDAEQFRYLARGRRDTSRFVAMAQAYEAAGAELPVEVLKLSDRARAALGESYNTAITGRDAPEIADGAVAPRPDRERLLRTFESEGVASFDDLLAPHAFATFRRYLLESTIWHDFAHIPGFVASHLEDGLACPVLLQIADEVRAAFPALLRDAPLSQAWSYKAVEPKAAVDVHRDDGAVSLNFWMTPAAANLTPARGGMVVCRAPPPEWPMTGYEQDRARALAFLEQHRGDVVEVPYRENRAVLFRSGLLHYSDRPDFADGYEHHRINVTLLFGKARR